MEPYARELAHDLDRAVEGEVRFSAGDRALYATGGSNYRQLPIGDRHHAAAHRLRLQQMKRVGPQIEHVDTHRGPRMAGPCNGAPP